MDKKRVVEFLEKRGAKFFVDYPMSRYVSMKVGGIADVLYYPQSVEELVEFLREFKDYKSRLYVLGGGTNVVVREGGIRGVVISLRDIRGMNVTEDGNRFEVEVFAGEPLGLLVKEGMRLGFKKVEKLAGIPGTVGGAIMGNAGLDRKGIGEFVAAIELVTLSGRLKRFERDQLKFSYRNLQLPMRGIIVKALLYFEKGKVETIRKKVIEKITEKTRAQPTGLPSAGSVFKNPPGRKAWKLIDDAGLRGLRLGGVRVSPLHANFIVKEGDATADEFETVVDLIKLRVKKVFGIELEEEVKIIGEKKR